MSATSWNGQNGDWTDPAQWNNGVPTTSTDALITTAGTYVVTISPADQTVAHSVTLSDSSATLDLFGTLTTNSLVATAGTVVIDGTLQNATIALAGGTVGFGASAFAAFSDVTWTDGSLDLGTGSTELLITNGLTVQGSSGAPGTIDLEGSFSELSFEDGETLSAVTINIGSATGDDALNADATLTLAASTTLNLLAGADFAELSGAGTLINAGTITALSADGVIGPQEFFNTGILVVGSGGTLAVQPGDVFTNSGSIVVDAGGTLAIQYLNGFVDTGTVTVAAAGLLELGNTTLSGGGTLDLFGTLDGASQVLTIGTAGAFANVEIDGTLQNATIALAGGTVTFGASAIASFNDVAWTGGSLDLGTGSTELLITNGLTVQGSSGAPGTIDLEGSFSELSFEDGETLSAVTINIGSATGDDALNADATLTLAASTTLNLLAGADFAELSGAGTLINAGTITALAADGVIGPQEFFNTGVLVVGSGGTLAVQPGDVFTNSGSIVVDAGGTLAIQYLNGFVDTGTVTVAAAGLLELGNTTLTGGGTLDLFGTLDGASQVLTIGTAGAFANVVIDGTLQNATIALAGGTVGFGASAFAEFSNVTWTGGSLDLGTGSTFLQITNGLTVQGSGGAPGIIDLDGSFSDLDILDAETLSAMTINIGSATGADDALAADATLTLAASTTLDMVAGAHFAELTGSGTLINAGTITALATDGVIEPAEFSNTGILVVGSGGTLGVQPGDIFDNSGSIVVDAGGTLAIQYLNGFKNSGTLSDLGGAVTIGATIVGNGLISLSGGSTIDLQAGATGGTVSFASASDTLLLDTTNFSDTLTGFGTAGTLDLTSVTFVSGATAAISGTTLTLTDGTASEIFSLGSAPAAGTSFYVYADQSGGTDISSVPCYCPGTLIRTVRGEVAIEDLAIGDEVVTAAGEARPIRWIGRRSYSGRFAARNPDVLPVLIRAGALDDNVPKRDLLVSPLHAMFIDGVLIPAASLVNGRSIVVIEAVERVEYIHLELASHDIILAEGAPAESFVDDNSRGMFHNVAEYHSMHPDAVRMPARYCAPRVEDGDVLELVRQRIALRLAPTAPRNPGPLLGYLDRACGDRIDGWAYDTEQPGMPVRLRILDDGVVIGHAVADRFRADLEQAGIGDGRHGYQLIVPGGLSPLTRHVVRVERVDDGKELQGSPMVIEAAPAAAAIATTGVTEPALHGMLDVATRGQIKGWARSEAHPDQPVALQILDNGVPIARVLANRHRADLRAAGFGDGRHAFEFTIPGGLSPLGRHVISVRCELDGHDLPGSPMVIEAADSFDNGLAEAVANAVAAVADDDARNHVASFMAAQLERLLQQRADADGGRTERQTYQQFKRRWGPRAEKVGAAGAEPRLRALVIDGRVPVAGRDAGAMAVLSHARSLQRLGYEVSFVAADDMAGADLTSLEAINVQSWGAPYYTSVEDVLRRQSDCFDLVYLHRAPVAARYLALARIHQPRARLLYSVADLHHVRLARQAAIEDRPELQAMSQQLRVAECTAAWSADAVITHSDHETEALRRAVPGAASHTVVWDVPVRASTTPFAERAGVAFIGGYAHAPNVDAAHWLVETVMPLVWRVDPAIACRLVGSGMPRSVQALARPGCGCGWPGQGPRIGVRPRAPDGRTAALRRRVEWQGGGELRRRRALRDEPDRGRGPRAAQGVAGAGGSRPGSAGGTDLPVARACRHPPAGRGGRPRDDPQAFQRDIGRQVPEPGDSGPARRPPSRAQRELKSFLVLFFKKELLA